MLELLACAVMSHLQPPNQNEDLRRGNCELYQIIMIGGLVVSFHKVYYKMLDVNFSWWPSPLATTLAEIAESFSFVDKMHN